jgi:MoxR-like ATPase
MDYTPKIFRLPDGGTLPASPAHGLDPYVFDDGITLAVDVALATHRPLLVSGVPGCGKTQLAHAIAAAQGWRLLVETITSRTRLETLTADVDQLRRLNDAQVRPPAPSPDAAGRMHPWRARRALTRHGQQGLRPDGCYLEPGIFWWAFDPAGAARRGLAEQEADRHRVRQHDRAIVPPEPAEPPGTVLLIDEIDKAEPDLPNDLLLPLDRRRFSLPAGFFAHRDGRMVDVIAAPDPEQSPFLLVITTNGERELPQAVMRRCVVLDIDAPTEARLVQIAQAHHPDADPDLVKAIIDVLLPLREAAKKQRVRQPGTAELLDAVHACTKLGIRVDATKDSVWSYLQQAVLAKDPDLRRGQP